MESPDPPFQEKYKSLFDKYYSINNSNDLVIVEDCKLPLIDFSRLTLGEMERDECKREIAKASQEWGFFQVINHGISREILERMRNEQVHEFKRPFSDKVSQKDLNYPPGSYQWGTPSAICLTHLSWSEAFHVPLVDINSKTNLSTTMEEFVTKVSEVAQKFAEILAEKMNGGNNSSNFFKENCLPSTCYLRMNRYPPCPLSPPLHGLMPHTDTSFLTVLHQDQIGGLQLVKDGKWIAVKPNQEVLIINIGDLFQAWSNGVYKSVEHRVVSNRNEERFSTACFFCPSYDTMCNCKTYITFDRTVGFD
ncbi:hypothetical protein LguiB_005118 [Lonicera macranthoides]